MSYLPQRTRRNPDIALLLKVCPYCLGDLVLVSNLTGDYHRCLQCRQKTEPASRIGRLPDLAPVDDSFPGAGRASREVLMG